MVIETAKVKKMNTELIKAVLKANPGSTKADIASATNLSQATCNTILNELVMTGEVLELDTDYTSGGRPAKRFRYNGDYAYNICLYINCECRKPVISYAVINMLGEIKEEDKIAKKSVDYNTLEELTEKLIEKYQHVEALGIGIPGVVINRSIIDICDVDSLTGFPLAEKLQSRFGINVLLENDMNLTALGFYHGQNYEEDTSVAVLNFLKGNCPGSGIIIDGHIVTGHTNFAGEISYLPFYESLKKYMEKLETREGIIETVGKSICAITSIINPNIILLTGALLSEDMLNDILKLCHKYIPGKHMPDVIYRKSIHDYYIKGLTTMTLESFSLPLKMVEKLI